MSVSDLPVELVDQQLEHLWDDKQTLSNCSLVCRSWLNGSRRVLFSDVNIVADLVTLSKFVKFIQHPSDANPSRHIRRLRIRSPCRKPQDSRPASDELNPFSRYLESILLLYGLRILELRDWELGNVAFPHKPLKLEELTLINVYTTSGSETELIDFIRQFPALRSLKLYTPYLSFGFPPQLLKKLNSVEDGTFPVNISRLETLALRHARLARYFMDIVALNPPVESLRSLDVTVRKHADVDALGGLLDLFGHNLTHFGICVSELLMGEPAPALIASDRLRLQNLTSLKSLTCYLNFCGEPWSSLPFNSTVLRNATQFLSHNVIRERVEVLTFCLSLDGVLEEPTQITRPLDLRLRDEFAWVDTAPVNMPRLCEIRWVWIGVERQTKQDANWREGVYRELEDTVRACYPALSERGILQFPISRYEI